MTGSSNDPAISRARVIRKAIPGLSGYEASEDGFIYSIRSGELRQLSMRLHNGYQHVNVKTGLGRDTKIKKQVHQLILMAFVGKKPSSKHVCRHIDGNPLNNHADNLAWGTTRENSQDSIRHGTAACLRFGQRANATKLSVDTIMQVESEARAGLKLMDVARRHGITHTHVRRIRDHKCHPELWQGDRAGKDFRG